MAESPSVSVVPPEAVHGKAVESQPYLQDDLILPVGSTTSSGQHAAHPEGSRSRNSGKLKRLSQSVPKRSKSHELVSEEEPWDAKNILSFDGGGVRGLYSLWILQLLMQNIKMIEENFADGKGEESQALSSFYPLQEPPNISPNQNTPQDSERGSGGRFLPCHYFDYICGTSTGGLIAIMLSRFRMTVEDCITEYENLAGRVFGKARIFHQMFPPTAWLKRPKYDASVLESVIRDVTRRRGEISNDNDSVPFRTKRDLCRTCVFAYRKDGHDNGKAELSFEVPYIFRSYHHNRRRHQWNISLYPRNPNRASTFSAWRVARATTAAPLYFAPMQVFLDGDPPQTTPFLGRIRTRVSSWREPEECPEPTRRPVTFIDGGFGEANNPSNEVFWEVTTLNEKIGTFVSIGTGKGNPNRFHTGLRPLIHTSFAVAGDPEPAHSAMQAHKSNHGFSYFRLNQPNALANLEFDEWKPRKSGCRTKRKIQDSFRAWAVSPQVQADINRCAQELVRRRRLRTADFSKWERYASGAFFDCEEDDCPKTGDKRWHNRDDFKNHLINDHQMEEGEQLQNIINLHRREWTYKPPGNGGTG